MKLKYYLDKNKDKIYTLKQSIKNQEVKEAHYKFIKYIDNIEEKSN